MLFEEAYKIDKNSIVVKRLKRTQSIIRKLKRFKTMKLRNMQDIAGCRAILNKQKDIDKLKKTLNKKHEFKITDYIKKPKDDGYRGVHLTCKCNDDTNQSKFPVEIQLRTKIQHSWATAVEIVDLFTNQKLKLNDGKQEWLDFFKYISHCFAELEGNHEGNFQESLEESIRLIKKLNVHKKFNAFKESIKILESNFDIKTSGYYLIEVNLKEKTTTIHQYKKREIKLATDDYLKKEQESAKNQNYIVALVSLESVDNLKEAYPNYFADSELFLQNVKTLEIMYNIQNPSLIIEFLKKHAFNFLNK